MLLRLPPSEFDDDRASWGLSLAGVAALKGDGRLARAYGDSARIALEEQLRAAPEDAQLHVPTASRWPIPAARRRRSAKASGASHYGRSRWMH